MTHTPPHMGKTFDFMGCGQYALVGVRNEVSVGISETLKEILACPFCKSRVEVGEENIRCTEPRCGLVFPIRDGIPVMLIEEADRTCPECGASRDWKEDLLSCSPCGAHFRYERN